MTVPIKQFKIIKGKKYDLYTTYITKEDARKAAEILRRYGERAIVIRTYDGYTVYHRDEYTDRR